MNNTELLPCREEFEKWYTNKPGCPSIAKSDGKYVLMQAHAAWLSWQAAWNTRVSKAAPVGDVDRPVTKSMDDLLFRLGYWGNFYYEDGCKFAHEILLDYREELYKLVEDKLSQPKQSAPVERIEGLAVAISKLASSDYGDRPLCDNEYIVIKAARAYLKLQGGD